MGLLSHRMGLVVQFSRFDSVPYCYPELIFTQSVQAFFAGLYFLMFLVALKTFDVRGLEL